MTTVTPSAFIHGPLTSNPALDASPARAIEKTATTTDKKDEQGGAQNAFSLFGDDGFDFFDILDIINPLQHIPIVSSFYRQLTGDEISDAPRVMGGGLFGGPLGAVASLFNVFVDHLTGKDFGEHVLAMFSDSPAGPPTNTAANNLAEVAAASAEATFTTATGAHTITQNAIANVGTSGDANVGTSGGVNVAANIPGGTAQAALSSLSGSPVPAQPLMARAVIPPRRDAPDLGALGAVATRPKATRSEVTTSMAASAVPAAPIGAQLSLSNASPSVAAAEVLRQIDKSATAYATAKYRSALEPNGAKAATRQQQAVSGATAPGGGWFSEVMLAALQKYDAGAKLGQPAPGARVNLLN